MARIGKPKLGRTWWRAHLPMGHGPAGAGPSIDPPVDQTYPHQHFQFSPKGAGSGRWAKEKVRPGARLEILKEPTHVVMAADYAEFRPISVKFEHHPQLTAYAEFVEIPAKSADPEPTMLMWVAKGFPQRIGGTGCLPALILR
jgi:hypothetical protein